MEKQIYLEKREVYGYPSADFLYAPGEDYPEYPFQQISPRNNEVYDMVRQSMAGLGLDIEHFGQQDWNPLGEYIKPGDIVVIKPNLVKNYDSAEQYQCTLTHPSVIRAVIDYCVIAKAGHIILGDAPVQSTDLNKVVRDLHLDSLVDFYRGEGVTIEFKDFRSFICTTDKTGLIMPLKDETNGPGHVVVHMGKESKHYCKNFIKRYGICGYDDIKINRFHNGEVQDYVVNADILKADVIINIPKPKTHRFAGLTGAQKNFIGCCSDKESLPHYTQCSKKVHGDETNKNTLCASLFAYYNRKYMRECKKGNFICAKMYQYPYRLFKKIKGRDVYLQGMWYGNDTIWRTIVDLNKIIRYADREGKLTDFKEQRKVLTIGDMIICGQKEGPMDPDPKKQGMILSSRNCALFDYVFCKIAGFDEKKIPVIYNSIRDDKLNIANWENEYLFSNDINVNQKTMKEIEFDAKDRFEPHPFWKEILQGE